MGRQRPADPALPYDPGFTPPEKPGRRQLPKSWRNFIELCERLTVEDEKVFEELWRKLGLSVDWSRTYQTIDADARATSQQAFLDNLARGEAYVAEAPTLWDVTFRTAVAQAELEDRERPAAYHRLSFRRADDRAVLIETTRPELPPACVALVAHPDDERYQDLFGTTVRTPLFGIEVPVFGDTTDVTWWRELRLDTRPAPRTRSGRAPPPAPRANAGTSATAAGTKSCATNCSRAVLPFATEEVWSWWRSGSVHRAAWPDAGGPRRYAGDAAVLDTASEAIAAVRKAKSRARLSMRAEVTGAAATAPRATLDRFAAAEADVRAAGTIGAVELREAAGDLRVDVAF